MRHIKLIITLFVTAALINSCGQEQEKGTDHDQEHHHEETEEQMHEEEHQHSDDMMEDHHEEQHGPSAAKSMHGHDYVDEATLKEDISLSDKSLSTLINDYLSVKDALVSDDKKKAAEKALKMHKALGSMKEAETLTMVSEAVMSIHTADNIEQQRQAFSQVSGIVTAVAKDNKLNTVLYKQYCPMAFDNKGAFWLSSSEEIRNPYFGASMLKCGSVEEKLQ